MQQRAPGLHGDRKDLDDDFALARELDGIARQVGQDLAQPMRISEHQIGNRGVHVDDELQVLRRSLHGHHRAHILDAFPDIHFDLLDLETPGLDLGEVQDVIEDAEQRGRARANRLRELELPGCSGVSSSSSVMPSTPFIGVRISWLMFARNSLFARFAAAAASFAATSAASASRCVVMS